MISYTVVVETREGDKFRGIYPSIPTRAEVQDGVRGVNNPISITRLIAVIKSTKRWPDRVAGRTIEAVRVEGILIGKVVFDIQRGR